VKLKTFSAVILASVSVNAFSGDGAYWTTEDGGIFRSATTGECVRTITWTPERAIEECEGEAAAKPAPEVVAPVVAAPVVAAQLDSDGDGVTDDKDKCPDSPPDKPVDENGCTIESVVLEGVTFELNSAQLTPASSESLDAAVAAMNKYDSLRIEIQAHTDSMGDAAYNMSLSEKRAASVRDYMVSAGIAADRMVVKGYGETQPIADNDTREGRAANRRVELKVLD